MATAMNRGGTALGTLDDELTNGLIGEAATGRKKRPGVNQDPFGITQDDPYGADAVGADEGGDDRSPEVEPTKVELPPLGPMTAPPPPTYDYSRTHGYDEGKFGDLSHTTGKYSMGRALSQFDPRQGITSEVLAALNGLGYGNFSGRGDKLSLGGLTDAGRKAGLTGDYADADFIEAYNSGNGKWGYADPAYEAANGGGDAPLGPLTLDPNRAPDIPGIPRGANTYDPGSGADNGKVAGPQTGMLAPGGDVDTSEYTPQEAAAAGVGWVPKNHPSYGTPGFVGYKAPVTGGEAGAPKPGTPSTPAGKAPPREVGPIFDNPNAGNPNAPVPGPVGGPDPVTGAQPGLPDYPTDPDVPMPEPPDPNDTSLEGMMRRMLYKQALEERKKNGMQRKLHETIIGGINDAGKPVDMSDPDLAARSRTYRVGQEKALNRGREAMADRASAEGLTTGAFDASLQSSYENMGSDAAQHDSDIMGERYAQKIQQMQMYLSAGAGILSDEETQALQSQIAQLKARMDEMGLTQTGDLANEELDLRRYLGDEDNKTRKYGIDKSADIDWARLSQEDKHFLETLGFNIGSQQGDLQAMLMKLLLGR